MPLWLKAVLGLLAITGGLNLIIYLAEWLLGLSSGAHSIVGAVLIVLGALFAGGTSGGAHLAEKAQVRAVTGRDLKQYGKDLRSSFNAAVVFFVVGAATLGLAILLH